MWLLLTPLLDSRVLQIFKSTYFEEHLQTTASKNVLIKLRKIKIYSYGVLILH